MSNIKSQLEALSIETSGDIYDHEYDGGTWMLEAVQTTETIENFVESSKNYNECSAMMRGTVAGLPFVVWKTVQVRKGDARRSVAVIDFGDTRFVIDHPMGDWTE